MAEEYGWPLDDAKILRSWWFAQCPELEAGMSETRYLIGQHGRIRHAFGQIMWYPTGKLTEAINGYAQSNEALVMIDTILDVSRQVRDNGWREQGVRQILSVHDSGTWNTPTHLVSPLYETVIQPTMVRAIPELGGFRFRHSAEVSKRWDWSDDTPDHEPLTFAEWKLKYTSTKTEGTTINCG